MSLAHASNEGHNFLLVRDRVGPKVKDQESESGGIDNSYLFTDGYEFNPLSNAQQTIFRQRPLRTNWLQIEGRNLSRKKDSDGMPLDLNAKLSRSRPPVNVLAILSTLPQ